MPFYKCTKCGFRCGSKREADRHKCSSDTIATRSIRTPELRGSIRGRREAGGLQLAFCRGYQAGYEDRVMGKQPEFFAETHRKGIRKRES